jgi:hypothetical protein
VSESFDLIIHGGAVFVPGGPLSAVSSQTLRAMCEFPFECMIGIILAAMSAWNKTVEGFLLGIMQRHQAF